MVLTISILGESQIPPGYYDAAKGYGGMALKTALYNIIKGQKEYEYTADTTDVWDILKDTDRDTLNSNNVICLYTGRSVEADLEWDDGNGWSREHVWSKSRGQFDPTIYGPGAGTDVHNLRPADPKANTAKNNKWFANGGTEYADTSGCYTDQDKWTWEPRDIVKGDVARMIFYMATRYNGENGEPDLELVDTLPPKDTQDPVYAKLSALLAWNAQDPVSNWERNRNNIIYTKYQHNRNPFIDHPEWVGCIWGNDCSGIWFTSYPKKKCTDRSPYSYSISASCSMDSTLIISCDSTIPSWLTFSSLSSNLKNATASLEGAPALKDTGVYPIYLTLTNGKDSIIQHFTITVADGNPIRFTSTPVTSVYVGKQYTYNITATGDDTATFKLTGTKLPAWLSLTNNIGDSATLTGMPDVSDIGADTVILTLTDDTKKTITQQFIINVYILNHLIITQYYEGLHNDKYIEISNLGDSPVDLSSYYLARWGNTDAPTGIYSSGVHLSGTINARQTLVYKNSQAATPAYAASTAIVATEATYFNGNDPVALLRYGKTWDYRVDCIYGSTAGGTYWGQDKGFYRKPDMTGGNKDMSILDGTGEWVPISIEQADDAASNTSEYLGYYAFSYTNISEDVNNFYIYPNPVKNILHFESENKIVSIDVLSLTGKIISQKTNIDNSVSVANLKKGIYILKIKDDSGAYFFSKFVKE